MAVPLPPLACCCVSLPWISTGLSAVALVAAGTPWGVLAMSYVAQLSSLVQEEPIGSLWTELDFCQRSLFGLCGVSSIGERIASI